MKLEIKHLAPYLEYELQIQFILGGEVVNTNTLSRIIIDNNRFYPIVIGNDKYTIERIGMFKPILKSLHDFEDSDIEKVKEFMGVGNWCKLYNHFFDAFFDDSQNIHNIIFQASYNILQYFFANHYDVFGLIPAGLAIDIKII